MVAARKNASICYLRALRLLFYPTLFSALIPFREIQPKKKDILIEDFFIFFQLENCLAGAILRGVFGL